MNFGIAKSFGSADKSMQDKFNYLIDLLSKFTTDIETSSTASAILTKLLTVDGATSGLDADLLDGKHYSEIFASPTFSGLVTTSGQIKFPATQNASTDVNTLDDYEEGTFTPKTYGTTSAGTGTYDYQLGEYTKIGDMCFISGLIQWSAHTGTGNIMLGDLPFTCKNSLGSRAPITILPILLTYPSGHTPYLFMQENTKTAAFYSSSGSGGYGVLAMDTAAIVYFSGHYKCTA